MTNTIRPIQLVEHICSHYQKPLNRLKLEKLCFYSQAYHYALYDAPLIDMDFVAAEKGPSGSCGFFFDPNLTDGSSALQTSPSGLIGVKPTVKDRMSMRIKEPKQARAVHIALAVNGSLSGSKLSEKTHNESPWKDSYAKGKQTNIEQIISSKVMRSFYKEYLRWLYFRELGKYIDIIPNEKSNNMTDLRSSLEEIEGVNFCWETVYGGAEGTQYFYSAPKLGIIVNNDSVENVIADAIENMKHQNGVYLKEPNDHKNSKSRKLLLSAYEYYCKEIDGFLDLLGLNELCQQRGEMTYVDTIVKK